MKAHRLAAVAVLAIAALATGCVRAHVTRYRTLAPKPVESVQVFTEQRPEREYEEIGLIEVEGADATNYGKLVARALREAAKMGADAVIVSRRPIHGANAAVIHGPISGASVRETEDPRVWVVPVVWREQAKR